MNQSQKRLVLVSLVLFWSTVLYVPQCGGTSANFCGAMDGYDFLFSEMMGGIYLPTLIVEWVAIAVNYISLYFLLENE